MQLETKRLILREWKISDATSLYNYAKDPLVGPIAGWPSHTSVEHSEQVIKDILSAKETFAVVIKDENAVVGSIGIMIGKKSNIDILSDEGEIGYWIGVPYWGQGLIPEAVSELLRYGFENLGLNTIWCGYYDGNEKSHRVQQKCGFIYHHTEMNKPCDALSCTYTEHFALITKTQWLEKNKEVTI